MTGSSTARAMAKMDGYSDKYLTTARREGEKCCGGDDADYAAVLVY